VRAYVCKFCMCLCTCVGVFLSVRKRICVSVYVSNSDKGVSLCVYLCLNVCISAWGWASVREIVCVCVCVCVCVRERERERANESLKEKCWIFFSWFLSLVFWLKFSTKGDVEKKAGRGEGHSILTSRRGFAHITFFNCQFWGVKRL